MPFDLYGRFAIQLNQILNKFCCEVYIEKAGENRRCNAKSLLGILSLGVKKDDEVIIKTNCPNYEEVFFQIKEAVKSTSK